MANSKILIKIAYQLLIKYSDTYSDVSLYWLADDIEYALRDLLRGEFEFTSVYFYSDKFALHDKFDCSIEIAYEDLHRHLVENYI